MHQYHLADENSLQSFSRDVLPFVQKSQLLLLDIDSQLSVSSLEPLFTSLLEKTSQFFLFIDAGYKTDAHFRLLQRLGGRNFCYRQKLERSPDVSSENLAQASLQPAERSLAAAEFERVHGSLRAIVHEDVRVVPELELTKVCLDLFFPTVQCYERQRVPFILVQPAGLSLESDIKTLREQFRQIDMFADLSRYLYFSFDCVDRELWNARVRSIHAGPRVVDIDLTNLCSHHCVFCGLYAEEVVREKKTEQWWRELTRASLEKPLFDRVVSELPWSTELVQLGGAGDPFIHPEIIDCIAKLRHRNIQVQALTNFDYLDERKINVLHELTGRDPLSVNLIINFSAASAAVYGKTRGLRSEATFHRVLRHLRHASDLFLHSNKGFTFWMMCVVNRLNFHELPEFVCLARETGAAKVWFKPMELHGEAMQKHMLRQEDQADYALCLQQALFLADLLQVEVNDRHIVEAVIAGQQASIRQALQHRSLDNRIHDLAADRPLIAAALSGNLQRPPVAPLVEKRIAELARLDKMFVPAAGNTAAPNGAFGNDATDIAAKRAHRITRRNGTVESVVGRAETVIRSLGVSNADVPADYYDQNACHIGYQYVRIGVDGSVSPCCVSPNSLSNLRERKFRGVWSSAALAAFRQKTAGIHRQKFHRTDTEWLFCQQCPHTTLNQRYNACIDAEPPLCDEN